MRLSRTQFSTIAVIAGLLVAAGFCSHVAVAAPQDSMPPQSEARQSEAQQSEAQQSNAAEANTDRDLDDLSDDPDNTDASDSIRSAVDRIAAKTKYQFRYDLKEQQKLFWKVEHVTTTKTQIAGTTEEASARVETLSSWEVGDVNKTSGEMAFQNTITAIKAWKKIGDQDPTLFDSRVSSSPPDEYAGIAENLGKPRSRITIDPAGTVLDRQSDFVSTDFSTGDITIPLPTKKVPVGYRWNVPTEFESTNEYGAAVQLKARTCYEFFKVKQGNAYVSFRTEVLTPIESEKTRSKILQKLVRGWIVWNFDKGLPIQKRVQWDEKVQGYDGADSYLKYVGRMSIKLVDSDEHQAAEKELTYTSLVPLKVTPIKLRRSNERPELRR